MDTSAEPRGFLDARSLQRRFDSVEAFTVGAEEEILLVDPVTGRLLPAADEIVAAVDHPSVKAALPACQVESMTRPHADPRGVVAELAVVRRRLIAACGDRVAPAAAAVHPTEVSFPVGAGPEHHAMEREYGAVLRHQIVGALQVHVAIGSADAALAVHNTLRGHLPELAALAAAAPFHRGRDTGLASVRPLICGALPRQGVPPILTGWEHAAAEFAWGRSGGVLADPGRWWWELRPHVLHGTLEVRVPDVQPTLRAAGAVIGVVHALVVHLTSRFLREHPVPVAPTWRIEENRWRALHRGVHGELLDLVTGEPEPTANRLHRLLDAIEVHTEDGLDDARDLIRHPTSDGLRRAGCERAMRHLVDTFEPG